MFVLEPWIGGNTEVIGADRRKGLAPFNVDAPRLIDHTSVSDLGCYQVTINRERKVIIGLNSNCFEANDYICEYGDYFSFTSKSYLDSFI